MCRDLYRWDSTRSASISIFDLCQAPYEVGSTGFDSTSTSGTSLFPSGTSSRTAPSSKRPTDNGGGSSCYSKLTHVWLNIPPQRKHTGDISQVRNVATGIPTYTSLRANLCNRGPKLALCDANRESNRNTSSQVSRTRVKLKIMSPRHVSG